MVTRGGRGGSSLRGQSSPGRVHTQQLPTDGPEGEQASPRLFFSQQLVDHVDRKSIRTWTT